MASFEDYDEFGNYIGADLDSDEEEQVLPQFGEQQREEVAPLEGYDDEPMPAAEETALMEIEGVWFLFALRTFFSLLNAWILCL